MKHFEGLYLSLFHSEYLGLKPVTANSRHGQSDCNDTAVTPRHIEIGMNLRWVRTGLDEKFGGVPVQTGSVMFTISRIIYFFWIILFAIHSEFEIGTSAPVILQYETTTLEC